MPVWGFDLQDLFVVGLGCDITGAYLLARGLLIPTKRLPGPGLEEIAFGYGITSTADRIKDRIDASWGIFALLLGFFLQALGYFGQLLWDPTLDTGTREALVAAASGVVASLLLLLSWWTTKERLFKRTLRNAVLAHGTGEGWTRERAKMLVQIAVAGGFGLEGNEPDPLVPENDDEGWAPYVKRVFDFDLPDLPPKERD